ncbi:unnamed protein product [Protopolystoma xenopodis]|uniref:Secreted protein n=1 Tax=Protopolystoma xenopodis TaxID=117903 RepID=A0A448XQ69_9PLAT|nr:unnamed protein product [Protopolystoma xenopodis]
MDQSRVGLCLSLSTVPVLCVCVDAALGEKDVLQTDRQGATATPTSQPASVSPCMCVSVGIQGVGHSLAPSPSALGCPTAAQHGDCVAETNPIDWPRLRSCLSSSATCSKRSLD